MNKRRGQSVVEFALVIPLFTLLLFGLIYGGIMFLQWLNMSNDSRAEARRYAVMTKEQLEQETFPKTVTNAERFGSFYKVTQTISLKDNENLPETKDVVVTIELERDNKDLPNILRWMNWPPEKLKPLEYRMKLEHMN